MEKRQYKELVMPTSAPTVSDQQISAENISVEDDAGVDKRSSRRNRTLIAAEIRFNDNFAAVNCVIRNLSDTGALLKITDTNTVPKRFKLQIPMHGYEVDCLIISQAGHQIRVEFTGERRPLRSKKVQFIEPTSPLSNDANSTRDTNEYQPSPIDSATKKTKDLISGFRRQKFETK